MAKRKGGPRNRYALRVTRRGVVVGLLVLAAVVGGGAYLAMADGGGGDGRPALRQDPVVTDAMQADVRVVDKDYEPRDLTVPKGATVTWTWDSDLSHDVVDDRGRFNSTILEDGDEWSMTFADPGEYYYYCTLHHGMQGTIRVAE